MDCPLGSKGLCASFGIICFVTLVFDVVVGLFCVVHILVLCTNAPRFSSCDMCFFAMITKDVVVVTLTIVSGFGTGGVVTSMFTNKGLTYTNILDCIFTDLLGSSAVGFNLGVDFC